MFKQVLNRRLIAPIRQKNELFKRPLFYWLTIPFNRVDLDKIKQVGPDLACAEWLLRNGACVKWKDSNEYLTNYDVLMKMTEPNYVQAIKAINAGITYVGFPHFDGCKHIKKVKLIRCMYICDKALYMLSYLKDSLCHLEIVKCPDVTDAGLRSLQQLKNLKILKLEGISYLNNPESLVEELQISLPNAQIELK